MGPVGDTSEFRQTDRALAHMGVGHGGQEARTHTRRSVTLGAQRRPRHGVEEGTGPGPCPRFSAWVCLAREVLTGRLCIRVPTVGADALVAEMTQLVCV